VILVELWDEALKVSASKETQAVLMVMDVVSPMIMEMVSLGRSMLAT